MVQKKLPLINSAHGSETRNIINEIIKAVNDRGLEILSESAFFNWLDENGLKHRGEWVNANEYDRLSVVLHEGNSYTSKKKVPAGIDILNEEFWVVTGNYNAQIEYYRDEVNNKLETFKEDNLNVTLNVSEFYHLEQDGDFSYVIQGALNSGKPIIEFNNITKTIKKPIIVPESVKEIRFNKSKLIYDYTQTDNVTDYYSESMFLVDNNNDFKSYGGNFEYIGSFDLGSSYKGRISGLAFKNSSNVLVSGLNATGFNESGVLIGFNDQYCKDFIIEKCNLHHNRVAGLRFGSVDGLIIKECNLDFNGLSTDGGTGYGLAGTNNYLPKNIKVIDNFCNDNYRKGIDFHSGQDILISNNTCTNNKYFGIYVVVQNTLKGVVHKAGTIIITNNIIDGVFNDGTTTVVETKGISVGYNKGQGTKNFNDNWLVDGNTIKNIDLKGTNTFVYPIFISPNGGNKTIYTISNNDIIGDAVTLGIGAYGTSLYEGVPGSYSDVFINNNKIKIHKTPSFIYSFRADSLVRNVTIENEYIECDVLSRELVAPNSSLTNTDSIIKVNNNALITETVLSESYDFIVLGRNVPNAYMINNTVNNKKARDWNGKQYIYTSNTLPTDGYWRTGSIVYTETTTGFLGWRKMNQDLTNVEGTDWRKFGLLEPLGG